MPSSAENTDDHPLRVTSPRLEQEEFELTPCGRRELDPNARGSGELDPGTHTSSTRARGEWAETTAPFETEETTQTISTRRIPRPMTESTAGEEGDFECPEHGRVEPTTRQHGGRSNAFVCPEDDCTRTVRSATVDWDAYHEERENDEAPPCPECGGTDINTVTEPGLHKAELNAPDITQEREFRVKEPDDDE